jgi:ADP-heptose:LPS heptosyltransferase
MNRILVIRGGAIGDFILTLPALKALRDAHPNATLEILGYKHIAAIAERRFYADKVRSIEYGPLSAFFATNAELDPELAEYFRSFDLIVSYLFDPDGIFEANLGRAGARRVVCGSAKISGECHAARQLAAPIQQLGIPVNDYSATIFPSNEDKLFAQEFLKGLTSNLVALHPGSGSSQKNWPLENWIMLGDELLGSNRTLVVVGGEADRDQFLALRQRWQNQEVKFAQDLALPHLAAVLAGLVFIGHDSGISHLAAAAGAHCLLLFGPTDPAIWAPQGDNVRVVRSTTGYIEGIGVSTVAAELQRSRARCSGGL